MGGRKQGVESAAAGVQAGVRSALRPDQGWPCRTYCGRFFRLRNPEELVHVEGFFQYLIVADANWNEVGIKNFSFEKRLHHDIQQTCRHREKWFPRMLQSRENKGLSTGRHRGRNAGSRTETVMSVTLTKTPLPKTAPRYS